MTKLRVVRTIPEMKVLIRKAFDKVVSSQQQFFNTRLECGKLLVDLKAMVTEGESDPNAAARKWWAWYEGDAGIARPGRREAERCMAWVNEDEPAEAYKAHADSHRRTMRDSRERSRSDSQRQNSQQNQTSRESETQPSRSTVSTSTTPKTRTPIPPGPPIQQDLIDEAMAAVEQMNIPTRAQFARLFGRLF
jgi:hypothetical protein